MHSSIFLIQTCSPPQRLAIISAVLYALFKSDEYTAEIVGSLESRSATFSKRKRNSGKENTNDSMKKTYHGSHNVQQQLVVYQYRLIPHLGVPGNKMKQLLVKETGMKG